MKLYQNAENKLSKSFEKNLLSVAGFLLNSFCKRFQLCRKWRKL